MKKKKIWLIIILIVLILLIVPRDEQLRIRIIANSNSYYDQEIKMKIASRLANSDIDLQNLGILEEKVEYILKSNGYDYCVDVTIKTQHFPTKYYNNEIIPGGSYQTLVIAIGEAKGKNYWSILNPTYYGVGFEDVNSGDVEYSFWIIEKIKKIF